MSYGLLNLTLKSYRVLGKMYNIFRDQYAEDHPMCSENDVERAFLSMIMKGLDDEYAIPQWRSGLIEQIEAIR